MSVHYLNWTEYAQEHEETAIVERPFGADVDWSNAPDGSGWLFVIGLGRTGTTVTTRILNEHPDVYCADEDGLVLSLLGLLSSQLIYLDNSNVIHYHNYNKRPLTGAEVRRFIDPWRELWAPGARYCGDKLMGYARHRRVVRQAFPGCRFIHTSRHPLDQLSSLIDLPPGHSSVRYAHGPVPLWGIVATNLALMDAVSREEDVFTVEFEALFDPESLHAEAQGLFSWLGLEAPDGLIKYVRPPNRVVGRWRNDYRIERLLESWDRMGLVPREVLDLLCGPDWREAAKFDVVTSAAHSDYRG